MLAVNQAGGSGNKRWRGANDNDASGDKKGGPLRPARVGYEWFNFWRSCSQPAAAKDQRGHEQDQKDDSQDLGDGGGCSGNPAEPQHACHQCDNQEKIAQPNISASFVIVTISIISLTLHGGCGVHNRDCTYYPRIYPTGEVERINMGR